MASLLPGVYGSRQSEGAGCGVTGAVVALVDPARVEVREIIVGQVVWLVNLFGWLSCAVGLFGINGYFRRAVRMDVSLASTKWGE